MPEKVEAVVDMNGTIYHFEYTCDHAYVTMHRGGRTVIVFDNGRDDDGPISSVGFERSCRVIKRPI